MFQPIKKLGQNFLTDKNIAATMVSALKMVENDEVVEIGAGLGVLTEELAEQNIGRTYTAYAVEIDARFVAKLESMFSYNSNILVVDADIIQWLPVFEPAGEFKILGSLPFYITSPIIHSIIKMKSQPKICVLLVQKEVAEKIAAETPDASYMSAFVQTFYEAKIIERVSSGKFNPPPKVDGAVLQLTHKGDFYSPDFIDKYEDFLHTAYRYPRKMLNKVMKKEDLESFGIDHRARPNTISSEKWMEVFKVLNEI